MPTIGVQTFDVLEEFVVLWERSQAKKVKSIGRLDPCFIPQPLFYHGLGPWHLDEGDRKFSQLRSCKSHLNVRRMPRDSSLRLSVSPHQLSSSVSCDISQMFPNRQSNSPTKRLTGPDRPAVYFWTPDYWYRPLHPLFTYREQRRLLALRRVAKSIEITQKVQRRFPWSRKHISKGDWASNNTILEFNYQQGVISPLVVSYMGDSVTNQRQDRILNIMQQKVRPSTHRSAWDFSAYSIATELAMINRQLFLKIPASEIRVLVWENSSRNAPNIIALLAFSHRIQCLVTTEILREGSKQVRARLLAHFISVAEKCLRLRDLQGCHSVLAGLKSPPIYRLQATWRLLKRSFSHKYHLFENMCTIHSEDNPLIFMTYLAENNPHPFVPSFAEFLQLILDRSSGNEYRNEPTDLSESSVPVSEAMRSISDHFEEKKFSKTLPVIPNLLRAFLSRIQNWLSKLTKNQSHEDYTKKEPEIKVEISNIKQIVHETIELVEIQGEKLTNLVKVKSMFTPLFPEESMRLFKFEECSNLLSQCQLAAESYSLKRNHAVKEYLLKERYREERENFKISCLLENDIRLSRSRQVSSENASVISGWNSDFSDDIT